MLYKGFHLCLSAPEFVLWHKLPHSRLLLRGPNICDDVKISSRKKYLLFKYLQKLLDFHILYHVCSKNLKCTTSIVKNIEQKH